MFRLQFPKGQYYSSEGVEMCVMGVGRERDVFSVTKVGVEAFLAFNG